ncbi:transposase, partial [Acidiphilium sp.]|uniref:transposase n=1 Tax=Acidiphilium sp. TaxID=527 RepID=UPI003CFE398C
MARNAVQLQKGLSEAEFDRLYGTEEQCRAVVIKLRWPDGFSCPVCGGTSYPIFSTKTIIICNETAQHT